MIKEFNAVKFITYKNVNNITIKAFCYLSNKGLNHC